MENLVCHNVFAEAQSGRGILTSESESSKTNASVCRDRVAASGPDYPQLSKLFILYVFWLICCRISARYGNAEYTMWPHKHKATVTAAYYRGGPICSAAHWHLSHPVRGPKNHDNRF